MKFIKNIFKKEKIEIEEETKIDVPNLMMPEKSFDNKIDLMAPSTIPVIDEKPEEKGINLNESPGIENHLLEDNIQEEKQIPKVNTHITDAFNMSPNEPKVEKLDVNLHNTQKFCPECGTPNDVLNKFCVSCGNNFN